MYHNSDYQYTAILNRENGDKMHGSCRVITFCLLTTVLPTVLIVIPLYLRNVKYADVMYKISDSDVIQIHKGQSSIFCQAHSLTMNSTFNAFQMKGRPELSTDKKKHIRLKKSMILPDDTLEYWGFYLFKGASVKLKACSRYEGSKILVVKGDKILNTCGLLEGNKYTKEPSTLEKPDHVSVKVVDPREKNSSADINLEPDKRMIQEYNTKELLDNNNNENTTIVPVDNHIKVNNIEIENRIAELNNSRNKRNVKNTPLHRPNTVLDAGINHGGNALNSTGEAQHDSSVSSFENNLHICYDGNILINELIPYSILCDSTNHLEKTTTLKVTHDVLVDGYYYYIFYSDNDFIKNNMHVTFDIYKPKFEYTNMSESKVCINKTDCTFEIGFFSDELVIVEVPTKDGLSNDDDTSILTSVCHPRMAVYIFFPISVLLLILLFAFL